MTKLSNLPSSGKTLNWKSYLKGRLSDAASRQRFSFCEAAECVAAGHDW